jgi:alanine-glyoxylate transaminase/serine-glyoxylate transaminase/serine-pyruvate transaminase
MREAQESSITVLRRKSPENLDFNHTKGCVKTLAGTQLSGCVGAFSRYIPARKSSLKRMICAPTIKDGTMVVHTGRHFLQIPGPSNVPDRVLRAMDMPTIDHRGPEFAEMALGIMESCKAIFRTKNPVMIYPSSGTGAWEAAIVNTLSPGDKVLMAETGQFSVLWRQLAERFQLNVDVIPGDWRRGAKALDVEARLVADKTHSIKAVMVVHNETSTGVTSRVEEIRKAIDRAKHPALLFVDTVSSLGSIEYEHDAWGVDVSVGGSQKGLMMPPGLSFNAISDKAIAASKTNKMPRSYWDWNEIINANKSGSWPYTPATNLLYALKEAIAMLEEEGLDNVFVRHARHGAATRAAVRAWGLETVCLDPAEYSPVTTAVLVPEANDADYFRKVTLENFNMSLGTGLGKLKGRAFRIGHLGFFNDLMLMGTLSGVEMGLDLAGVPHKSGGVIAAMEVLKGKDVVPLQRSAVA